jgi:hypothetical protein
MQIVDKRRRKEHFDFFYIILNSSSTPLRRLPTVKILNVQSRSWGCASLEKTLGHVVPT